MPIEFAPFLTFVLVACFTPGPNNISSASMGILYGYKRTLPYLLGIITGMMLMMLLCGLIANSLFSLLPGLEKWLHYIGAAYILWLAHGILHASYSFKDGESTHLGYFKGVALQVVNPKVIVYGMTLYSTFLAPIVNDPLWMIISAVFSGVVTFIAVSTWTLFGSAIKTYLRQPRIRHGVNVVLALLLVYTAVDISDLIF